MDAKKLTSEKSYTNLKNLFRLHLSKKFKTKPLKSKAGDCEFEQFTLNKANQIERAPFGNCVRAIMTHDEADKGSSASEADQ
jgi:hypothetical protein